MTSPTEGWARWREEWREGGAAPGDLAATSRVRVDRERRRLTRTAAVEVALVIVAVSGILLALTHTPRGRDAVWGGVVLALLVLTWVVALPGGRRSWREFAESTESTESFVELSRRRCRRQLRAIHFTWLLIAIELAFFVPWWAEGLRIHAHELGSRLAVVSLWLPMVAIAALFAWTLRARRRLRAELAQLERVRKELREEASG